MDIVAINDAIDILLQSDTTPENVNELASLYICQANIQKGEKRQINAVQGELEDILPYYTQYRDIKRRYQMGQTNEGELIRGMKNVCREIVEFISALYCGTDMNKERICIRQMLSTLNEKYNE